MQHILDNQEQWQTYVSSKESDNVPMPGTYLDYDPAKEEKLAKRLKKLE